MPAHQNGTAPPPLPDAEIPTLDAVVTEMQRLGDLPQAVPQLSQLITLPCSPKSRPPTPAPTSCRCDGYGTLLERLDRARAEQVVILDILGADERARALVPCSCAAGRAVAARWRNLPAEATGVYLEAGRLRAIPDQRDARRVLRAFVQDPRGWVTLAGGYGVGKTLLIYAALNHLADRGVYGRYVLMPELLDELRDAVGTDLYGERLRRLVSAPILAIDELDKMRDSAFVDDVLHAIFLARYRDRGQQGTLIGYNLDGAARIPPFLMSRIKDSRFHFVDLGDKDLRPIAHKLDPWDRGEGEARQ